MSVENYNKWFLINQILNSLRKAKGAKLVPANHNPYKSNKGGVDDEKIS